MLLINKKIIYVTGLPRAGSTLLCQLLSHHPAIYSTGHSSPLSQALEKLRYTLSDEPFLLSQLDVDFELTYNRLLNAFRGFINGWFAESDKPIVVDKNRGWLHKIETVNLIVPDFRMLICVRDLGQIVGSIEAQHQKTLLLDFPDHLAHHSASYRADALFKDDGLIGSPLKAVEQLQDIVDEEMKAKLCYIAFEALVEQPQETMNTIFQWLGLSDISIDCQNLTVKPHESDSYYRFKYRHETYPLIKPLAHHQISPRIVKEIHQHFAWFYEHFYPEKL